MRTCIIGDSFAKTIDDTYLSVLRDSLSLDIIQHRSWPGSAEYFIYETFCDLLKSDRPDLAIFVHTEPSRLPNAGHYGINISSLEKSNNIPESVRSAAIGYYQEIYFERYHLDMYQLMMNDIQKRCRQNQIHQIHIMAFDTRVHSDSGLWIMNGLDSLAKDDRNPPYHLREGLLNHMTADMNLKFGRWLSDRCAYYLNKNLQHQIVLLNREELA
jgi:hypothetical protein